MIFRRECYPNEYYEDIFQLDFGLLFGCCKPMLSLKGMNLSVFYFSFKEDIKKQLQNHSKRTSLKKYQYTRTLFTTTTIVRILILLLGKFNKGFWSLL